MARYKPQESHSLLLPVVLSEQIEPGSFAFALSYLVDHELDFTAMDAQFRNDEVGASAYDPRVLLAYGQCCTVPARTTPPQGVCATNCTSHKARIANPASNAPNA